LPGKSCLLIFHHSGFEPSSHNIGQLNNFWGYAVSKQPCGKVSDVQHVLWYDIFGSHHIWKIKFSNSVIV
jgi:hypothetical protein